MKFGRARFRANEVLAEIYIAEFTLDVEAHEWDPIRNLHPSIADAALLSCIVAKTAWILLKGQKNAY